MDQNDKPFACSFPSCNQKFVTEDRLSIHMQKHDLNFENITASLFTDQTPTPTTFLRDCENMGLFQDLPLATKNPFDECFRKAVIDPDGRICDTDGVDSPSIPILPDSASLLGLINTPTGKDTPGFMKFRPIFLTPEVAKLHSQMSNDNLDTPSLESSTASIPLLQRVSIDTPSTPVRKSLLIGLPSHHHRKSPSSAEAVEADDISKDNSSPCITPSSDGTISSTGLSQVSPLPGSDLSQTSMQLSTADLTSPSTSMQPGSISNGRPSPTVKPAEVAQARLAPTMLDQSNTSSFPQTMSAAHKMPMPSSIVRPANSSGQSLVMLHVNKSGEAYLVPANRVIAQANNKVVPVKLSTPAAPSIVNGSYSSLGSDEPVMESTAIAPGVVLADNSQSPLTLAKMKLKQALTKQHQSGMHNDTQGTLSDSETSNRSRHSSNTSGINKRSLSRSDDDLDEHEKKMKSLQRNRDAARRCRKKKKFFMQTLEDKLKATTMLNTQLQSENAKLKMEIVELKSAFIAHKDCEVTKKQLSEGSLNSLLMSKAEEMEAMEVGNSEQKDTQEQILGAFMYY